MKYNNSSGCIDSKVKNYHFICKDIDRIYLKVNFKHSVVFHRDFPNSRISVWEIVRLTTLYDMEKLSKLIHRPKSFIDRNCRGFYILR